MTRLISLPILGVFLAAPTAAHAQASPTPTPVAADFVARRAVAEPLPAALATALAGITAPALAAHVAFLASPALEGRGLGDRGLDAAAEYVAASLALAGIAAPDTGEEAGSPATARFQAVPIRAIDGVTGTLTIAQRRGELMGTRSFATGVDYLPPRVAPQSITAPVVFASYGIREEALGHDDTRGLDARGKILLVVAGLPPGPQWRAKELQARYDAEDPDDRYTARLEWRVPSARLPCWPSSRATGLSG